MSLQCQFRKVEGLKRSGFCSLLPCRLLFEDVVEDMNTRGLPYPVKCTMYEMIVCPLR